MSIDKKNLNIKYFINIGLKLQNFLTIAMLSKMQYFLLSSLLIATSLAYSQQANIENVNTDTSTYVPADSLVTVQGDTLQTIEKTYTIYGIAAYGNGLPVPDAEVTLLDTLEKTLEKPVLLQNCLEGFLVEGLDLKIFYPGTILFLLILEPV